MVLGVISDSHDNHPNIQKSISVFKERKVDFVIHAGDFVCPASVRLFKGLKLIGVLGNNDGEILKLARDFALIDGELLGQFGEKEFDGLRFAIYHGQVRELTRTLIGAGAYDVVVTGHTHQVVHEKVGKTLVLNPGTVHGFGGQATVMIYDTKKTPEVIEIS